MGRNSAGRTHVMTPQKNVTAAVRGMTSSRRPEPWVLWAKRFNRLGTNKFAKALHFARGSSLGGFVLISWAALVMVFHAMFTSLRCKATSATASAARRSSVASSSAALSETNSGPGRSTTASPRLQAQDPPAPRSATRRAPSGLCSEAAAGSLVPADSPSAGASLRCRPECHWPPAPLAPVARAPQRWPAGDHWLPEPPTSPSAFGHRRCRPADAQELPAPLVPLQFACQSWWPEDQWLPAPLQRWLEDHWLPLPLQLELQPSSAEMGSAGGSGSARGASSGASRCAHFCPCSSGPSG
mmetsp:Transcript_26964/g.85360  ORF Transcript_26964/g.85360 Transcript_26964/m.85360 type:complete len:298 (+) Transcript_26964:812-1705(+)